MTPEDRIESIQSALQRRFRAAGHGSIGRVQEILNLGTGYFKDQRRPGRRRVDLRILFRTLDELDVEPADFFADALGTVDMQTVFRSQAAALRRRMRKLPRLLELESERLSSKAGDRVSAPRSAGPRDAAPPTVELAELAELDAEAAENPKRAVRRAHTLMRRLPRQELPRLLGIAASAYRRLAHPDTAHVILGRALEMIGSRLDLGVRADLLRRASRLLASQESCEQALGLSELAMLDYVRSGDLAAAGTTLADQGGMWMGRGRWRRALDSFASALNYLPGESERSDVRHRRCVCLMSAAKCHQRLGHLDPARRLAVEAAELSGGVSSQLRGELAWLLSSIALQCGDWRQAENCLLELLEIEPPIAPLDRARASVELIRSQLFAARTLEAYETAKKLTLLVQPLERNRAASAALMELLRIALAGRGMTPDLVDRVARSLHELRAQRLASLVG